jgi:uncharacterized protein
VITPKFRAGDFAGGISDGVARIVAVINGEGLPAPAPEASHQEDNNWISFLNPLNPFVIFGIYFIATIYRSPFGRFVGSVAAGGVVAALAWYLVGSIAASIILGAIILILTFLADSMIVANQNAVRRSGRGGVSGGWVGGSYSGGGWGGGSGSGGFSGGGGGFGGGGASGSW